LRALGDVRVSFVERAALLLLFDRNPLLACKFYKLLVSFVCLR
jgi:hypothetical protein